MERVLLIDISRHQGVMDFKKAWAAGARGVIHRVTVGDYYSDDKFKENYKRAQDAGFEIQGGYMVIAPADPTYSRQIGAGPQLRRFLDEIGDRVMTFPHVADCELDRKQSKDYVTRVIVAVVTDLPRVNGLICPIYTRQSWWDRSVYAHPEWKSHPLWAARYRKNIEGPWGDGLYKFRDWQTWKLWQFSADGNYRGAEFGASSQHIDLDYFNGSYEELKAWLGMGSVTWQAALYAWAKGLGYNGPEIA